MARPEVRRDEPNLLVLQERNLLVWVWTETPLLEQMRWLAGELDRIAHEHPAGTGLLDIILSGTPRFSDGVRNEVTRLSGNPRYSKLGVAHVALLPGLSGTAVRAFLQTVMLVARPPQPTKVFGDREVASQWLATQLSKGHLPWAPEQVSALFRDAVARRMHTSSTAGAE